MQPATSTADPQATPSAVGRSPDWPASSLPIDSATSFDSHGSPEAVASTIRLRPGIAPPDFSRRLVTIDDVLAPEAFEHLKAEIEGLVTTERSYLPTHKKGGTVAYETLIAKAPLAVGLYRSHDMRSLVSRIVGLDLQPTPLHDQSSCSVLFYERPGDHIGWHYDHNFYRGRHFTVLLPVVNRNQDGTGLSHAQLLAKQSGGEVKIETPPNRLIVFEGARVVHKVTPIAEGERRIVLSMTYCADPRNSRLQDMARRVKDTAFFGLRALWR